MRVLLVSPNIESTPDPVFPLGLAFLAGELKREDIPFRILDLCFVDDYDRSVRDAVREFQPDIVGLSLRNLDNVSYPEYVSYLPFYREVIASVRSCSNATIVLGGSGFSLAPDDILGHLGGDYGIVGESESSFVELVKSLDPGYTSDLRPGPGVFRARKRSSADLDSLSLPDRSGFDNEAYLEKGGMGNIQTKRGCPFRCIYCTYPVIEGRRVRFRSPGKVCDEMELMLEAGLDTLFIVDNTFNYPPEHSEAVCREMIQRRLPVKWGCYAHPRFVTPGLVDLMLKAGCTGLEFGSDAAQEDMLRNLRKDFRVKEIRNASSICRDAGMSFCHSLLLGGPGETMESVQESLDNVAEMAPTAVICMAGIRIFPGTELALVAAREGLTGPDTDFLSPVFYMDRAVEDEILSFLKRSSKANPTWIFPGLNININPGLQEKLRRFGVRGPLWEYMGRGKRFRRR